MRVTILQTDIKLADPSTNQNNASILMEDAPGADIYVLPEMWPTGFITESELLDGQAVTAAESLNWMQAAAAKFKGAVCGSIAVRSESKRYRNRLFFVRPDGSYDFYDKRHLFVYGGEDKHYESGTKRKIVEYCGVRILLATCYDLRFPVWLRNKECAYDVILITANWPESRQEVWKTLLKARALENQCFVIGANRTGKDPFSTYCGGSLIIDAKGKTLAEAVTDKMQTVTADLDFDGQNRFRNKFPVLKDCDNFELIMK